jgi:hypothetical protein
VEANGSRIEDEQRIPLECGDEDGTASEFARPLSASAKAMQELTSGIEETHLTAAPVDNHHAAVGELSHTAYPVELLPGLRRLIS